jgi:hypothetical protein
LAFCLLFFQRNAEISVDSGGLNRENGDPANTLENIDENALFGLKNEARPIGFEPTTCGLANRRNRPIR